MILYETINRVPFFSTNLLGDMGLFTPAAHLSGAAIGFIFFLCLARDKWSLEPAKIGKKVQEV